MRSGALRSTSSHLEVRVRSETMCGAGWAIIPDPGAGSTSAAGRDPGWRMPALTRSEWIFVPAGESPRPPPGCRLLPAHFRVCGVLACSIIFPTRRRRKRFRRCCASLSRAGTLWYSTGYYRKTTALWPRWCGASIADRDFVVRRSTSNYWRGLGSGSASASPTPEPVWKEYSPGFVPEPKGSSHAHSSRCPPRPGSRDSSPGACQSVWLLHRRRHLDQPVRGDPARRSAARLLSAAAP